MSQTKQQALLYKEIMTHNFEEERRAECQAHVAHINQEEAGLEQRLNDAQAALKMAHEWDLDFCKKTLDENLYGLTETKERIYEFIAKNVRKNNMKEKKHKV